MTLQFLSFLQRFEPKTPDALSICFSNIVQDAENGTSLVTKVDLSNASVRKRIENSILSSSSGSSNIVLFKDAIEHILRICRVLQSSKGSIMLVGLGGSGKQSLTRVAASVNGSQFYQAGESDMYSDCNFLEDIKSAFRVSGIKNKSSCLLITNSSVKHNSFLDYTNQYLVTGDIAGLWEKEDLESIESGIRSAFREECRGNVLIESRLCSDQQALKCQAFLFHIHAGKLDTSENLYNYFMQRVNKNFHFIFAFSPAGGQLFTWSQQFPGLMSGCTIDWFLDWPQEALLSGRFGFRGVLAVRYAHARIIISIDLIIWLQLLKAKYILKESMRIRTKNQASTTKCIKLLGKFTHWYPNLQQNTILQPKGGYTRHRNHIFRFLLLSKNYIG